MVLLEVDVCEATHDHASVVGAAVDNFTEPIIHIDMDAFFVEAERLRRPDLVGIPVVVGGAGERGVVAAASYEARAFGVRSAMPIVTARRQCPNLTIVPGDHSYYGGVSRQVFGILRETTPLVEGLSIDEAFLDVSGLRLHSESPVAIANNVRARIRHEIGLPSSAGIAAVKLIAKIASGKAKPDGVVRVGKDQQVSYLHALAVRDLWGVGPATFAKLERFGVETIGDLARLPERTLAKALGPSLGSSLHRLAWAIDDRPVTTGSDMKSVSVEETFPRDIVGWESLETELLRLSDRLGERLHRAAVSGRTVTIKVRDGEFATVTRSHTLPEPTSTRREILTTARRLLRQAIEEDRPVRLLGVGVSALVSDAERQLSFGSDGAWEQLDDTVAEVRKRFGSRAIGLARLREGGSEESSTDGLSTEIPEPYTEAPDSD